MLKPPKLTQIASWIEDNYVAVGVGAAGFTLTVATTLLSDEGIEQLASIAPAADVHRNEIQKYAFLFLFLNAGFQILLAILGYRQSSSMSILKEEIKVKNATIDELCEQDLKWAGQITDLAQGHLFVLGRNQLRFGSRQGSSDRISLYVHSPDGCFIRVARYSNNTAFLNGGRPVYPDTAGCIAIAWREGRFYGTIPYDPETGAQRYRGRHRGWGLDETTIDNMNMKSRLYYALRIACLAGDKNLAVIVIESTAMDRYDEGDLDRMFEATQREYLSSLSQRLSANLPKLTDANKAGY